MAILTYFGGVILLLKLFSNTSEKSKPQILASTLPWVKSHIILSAFFRLGLIWSVLYTQIPHTWTPCCGVWFSSKKMIWANNHSVTLWCASSLSHIFLPFQIFHNAFEISPRHLVDSKFLQHLLQIFMQIVFSPIGADIFSCWITLAKTQRTRTLSASPQSKTQKYCQRHNVTGPVSCHQPIFNTFFNLKISKSDNINNFVFGAIFT